jgi:HEAT repeat protein
MKNQIRLLVLAALAVTFVVGTAVRGALFAGSGPPAQSVGLCALLANSGAAAFSTRHAADQTETLYREALRALNTQQWQTAISEFSQLRALNGRHSDEALYWKAYAQNKQGLRADALTTIGDLERSYPGSRWLNDARALELQVRQESGQSVSPQDQPDDQLKLLAINAVMNSDPERAIPLLEKLIESDSSTVVKERALFVLTQNESPKARQAVVEIARSNPDPAVRKKALDDLALFGGAESRQLLAGIYASSSDLALKRHILHDFMISGARQQLLDAARSEKTAELRETAVYQLGLAGGQAQLGELYQRETNEDVKKAILRAMFLGGNKQRLAEVARTDPDPELRREAIHALGLMGGQDQLAQLYHQESAPDIRKEIVHSMFLGHNAQALVEIARTETDPELRVEAIHSLGLIRDTQTGNALVSLYVSNRDRATRNAIVDALFIQGNAHALVELARKETDPETKKTIIARLSLMHSKEATDYMMDILNH